MDEELVRCDHCGEYRIGDEMCIVGGLLVCKGQCEAERESGIAFDFENGDIEADSLEEALK